MQLVNGFATFIATAALGDRVRVKLSSGQVVVAGATDDYIGITQEGGAAAGAVCNVRLKNDPGTFEMTASGAITKDAAVYAAASGKIAATGSVLVGYAREAASADGDIIEVIPDTEGQESSPDFSITAVDNEDGTATVTIAAQTRKLFRIWSSASAYGAVQAATTSIAAATGAVITSHTANGDLECVTDANGALVLTVTANDGTWYLNAESNGLLASASVTISGN